jgi:hypothetical protein
MGFGLVSGLIDNLYTPLETTSNYNSKANLHTLQFTVKHTLVFSVLTSRILATDVNSRDSSADRANVLPVRRISRN